MSRLSVLYSGRVQGVGFRATVAHLARSFAVAGRVCNLSDGRVELIAEGDRQELLRFQAAIDEALSRYIVDSAVFWSAPQQTWQDFAIAADKFRS